MRLYICRHGDAEATADSDEQRSLTPIGHREVRHIWQKLRKDGVVPARLVSSPYQRARQTADEIISVYPGIPCAESSLLVPDADPGAVLDWLVREPSVDGLILVSHMPLVSLLTLELVNGSSSRLAFATGSVASVDVSVAASGGARLVWLRATAEGW